MTATVFVDTNVLVYWRDVTDAPKQAIARSWLEDLLAHDSGRLSVQVLNEYYVTVTQKLTPGLAKDLAWADVQAFATWQPQVIDCQLLERGRDLERHYELSWWDALIVAAAQAQNCELLLSEDLQHGAVLGGVTVQNPFLREVRESALASAYGEKSSRHPARGRPRRRNRTGAEAAKL